MTLVDLIKKRTLEALDWTPDDLTDFINQDKSCLYSPFLYDSMDELITELYNFKMEQSKDPSLLLYVDTDYDTDGVMSAAVLSAALDVFNINYRVFIPTTEHGYGLTSYNVDDMIATEPNHKVAMILTADNGTSASGVKYAEELGIKVLVTDHHLPSMSTNSTKIVVNPNKHMDDGSIEPYPYKENAGGAVAWKTMMAYAEKYQPQDLNLIYDLIVFAGIANVADMMLITDENHFMTKEAVKEINRIIEIHKHTVLSPIQHQEIKDTPYIHYNTVFHGLSDLILLLQESKNSKAKSKNAPLPTDEQIIGWYLSPLINASRRVKGTSKQPMYAFISTNPDIRYENIKEMIELNVIKSELRDKVLDVIDPSTDYNTNSTVLLVNTQGGISGLISGNITSKTENASIVFVYPSDSDEIIYTSLDNVVPDKSELDTLIIGGSARSTEQQPLNLIGERINAIDPTIIHSYGGHAGAAGYSIYYSKLDKFKQLFDKVAKELRDEYNEHITELLESGDAEETPSNNITFLLGSTQDDSMHSAYYTIQHNQNLSQEIIESIKFQSQLKPFGRGFNAETKFYISFNPQILKQEIYKFNSSFWNSQSFTFNLNGVKVLTWDKALASSLKHKIFDEPPTNEIVTYAAQLDLNLYNGKYYPQMKLSEV